jgi:hypothetical protein
MAENEEKSASIPWLPLITLIGVGSGVLLFFPQLISSRPGGGDLQLAGDTLDRQTIDARLWQDPLGVAVADREKNEKQSEGGNQKYSEVHSVAQFQKLLIKKCFALGANCPLIRSAIYPLDEQLRLDAQVKQVQILAVMIPGGPYVEDVERRLRSRRAVIEGLGMAGYAPEKDHKIGYFYVPWQPLQANVAACVRMLEENRIKDEGPSSERDSGVQPARNDSKEPDANGLLVPYEWCEPADFGAKKNPVVHVLVLWLIDDAFRDAPLGRLADLTSWFRLKRFGASQASDFSPLPAFTVLGPDNSGTLHAMVMEAKDNPWNNETRDCLATTHIYSSQAAAAESRLLSEIPATPELRIPFMPDCKDLIERNVKLLQSDNGFCFDRTLFPDDLIVETLWKELECRGLKKDDHVAIVSEEDTYYSRALCSTFTDSKPKAIPPLNLHSYTYLRGIDGKLPPDGKDEKETKGAAESGDKNTQSSVRPKEQTEGLNQADDIRRLAGQLQQLDRTLRQNSGGLRAVGLLGSDVYDKLELLRALRPLLPEASFFTNNLDARFAHPDEWNETHNLVVVSAFRLSLPQYENVPPFRDSGQTALFAATLEAMDQIHAGNPAIPQSPLIFEIGRKGPIELSIPASERPTTAELSAELANFFQRYLVRIVCFIYFTAIGISLVVWTRFVTRVAPASSEAKTEPEDIVNKELISNEYPDSGCRPVEAT